MFVIELVFVNVLFSYVSSFDSEVSVNRLFTLLFVLLLAFALFLFCPLFRVPALVVVAADVITVIFPTLVVVIVVSGAVIVVVVATLDSVSILIFFHFDYVRSFILCFTVLNTRGPNFAVIVVVVVNAFVVECVAVFEGASERFPLTISVRFSIDSSI